ncbi:uncharacterized protein LOC118188075 [Stegodyphus dumicola]|uniref:uncharacterized protein LOC118188075 n=1 Tax=Stegodyphus dumicola TaxID=202533 RepID=UPI0015AA5453|nr:uncharacterized protein LOC118188075 [Stegodyphus dumicola]
MSKQLVSELNKIIEKYVLCDMYTMAETRSFYNLFPSSTLGIKYDKCHDGACINQRPTASLVCDADSIDKHCPRLIGKSENPNYFKNTYYFKNTLRTVLAFTVTIRKAWIDSSSFRNCLHRFNSQIVAQNKHVYRTLGRCTAHNIHDLNLTTIKIHVSRPYSTSRLQPLNQSNIAVMKRSYHKRPVRAAI